MAGPYLLDDDTACVWEVKLPDGVHKITFEHGSTTGKRVIIVDNVEVVRKNWMFKLVGSEKFVVGGKTAEITIDCNGMILKYTLLIDNKSLDRFIEVQAKNTRTWLPTYQGIPHRIVLLIDTMEVYCDGEMVPTVGEFTDNGTETHFSIGSIPAYIQAVSSGNKRKGLLYSLVVNREEYQPVSQIAAIEVTPEVGFELK